MSILNVDFVSKKVYIEGFVFLKVKEDWSIEIKVLSGQKSYQKSADSATLILYLFIFANYFLK